MRMRRVVIWTATSGNDELLLTLRKVRRRDGIYRSFFLSMFGTKARICSGGRVLLLTRLCYLLIR